MTTRSRRDWGWFTRFVDALSRLIEHGPRDEADRLEAAYVLLRDLVGHDDWLAPAFARPHPDRFQQYLLFCGPQRRFCVVSFVWGPGQRTPIHDHTTWGLVGLLSGAEISEAFEIRDGGPAQVAETRMSPGDVIAISPEIGNIHRVRTGLDDSASVSIQVYGGDIGEIERPVFLADGGVTNLVSSYSNRELPNIWGRHAR